ncbi:MAG: hypothetical protein AABP62_14850 [Planctomycetota bacterium]
MHPWDEVARRYDRLMRKFESATSQEEPLASTFFTPHEQSQLTQWLTDHVVPLAASFTHSARFRGLTAWSLRNLCPGCQTPARQSIVEFQVAFQTAVECLHELVKLKSVAKLASAIPPRLTVSKEAIEMRSGERPKTFSRQTSEVPGFELVMDQLSGLLADSTNEFFRSEDFFLTQQEFVRAADGKMIQNGLLVSGLWSRLEPLGDLIARSGRQRIESRLELLATTRRTIFSLPISKSAKNSPRFLTEATAHTDLETQWARLKVLIFEDAASRLRDSCSAVTQVYAAYGSKPDLTWLELSEDRLLGDPGCLPVFLRGFQAKNLFDRIARSVRNLGSVYDLDEPETPVWHDAIASGALVLIEVGRRAHWEGKPIDLGKGDNKWRFLWLLADHARTCRSVTEHDVFPMKPVAPSAMPTAWSRLTEKLPISLVNLVESDPNQNRAYRLKLESDRIRLFRRP